LLLYVHDILLFADVAEIERVQNFMMNCDQRQSAIILGMNIEVLSHKIIIDMNYYIQQLLSEVEKVQNYSTPAVKECFQLAGSVALDTEAQQRFHTIVAKLPLSCKACEASNFLNYD
jgi:hypothetical protein